MQLDAVTNIHDHLFVVLTNFSKTYNYTYANENLNVDVWAKDCSVTLILKTLCLTKVK